MRRALKYKSIPFIFHWLPCRDSWVIIYCKLKESKYNGPTISDSQWLGKLRSQSPHRKMKENKGRTEKLEEEPFILNNYLEGNRLIFSLPFCPIIPILRKPITFHLRVPIFYIFIFINSHMFPQCYRCLRDSMNPAVPRKVFTYLHVFPESLLASICGRNWWRKPLKDLRSNQVTSSHCVPRDCGANLCFGTVALEV